MVAPDLRGFGGTAPFEGPPSVDQMADDVAALLEALKISVPVVLGGLSMGGYVALAFARRHPGRLRGLILADTKAQADSAEARANRDGTIAFLRDHGAADVIAQMLPKLVSTSTQAKRPEVVEEIRRLASAQSPAGLAAALQALRDRPDATQSLAHIAVPTLIVVGQEDVLTPPTVAQALAGSISGSRVALIDGAGHMSNLECPESFNAAVRAFLDELN